MAWVPHIFPRTIEALSNDAFFFGSCPLFSESTLLIALGNEIDTRSFISTQFEIKTPSKTIVTETIVYLKKPS